MSTPTAARCPRSATRPRRPYARSPCTTVLRASHQSQNQVHTAAPSTDHGVVDADAGSPSADAPSPALPPPLVHAAHATTDDPVYLNEASTEDLRRLPGIGEKRARAILELRAKLGRFRQIDDLLRVKGIGRAAIKRLRPLVRLDASDAGR
jgi:competence protein ComEA